MNNHSNTLAKYKVTLHHHTNFGISSIFASFYASRSYLSGGVNWLRADLSPCGTLLICLFLLSSPALLPHLHTGVGSLNIRVPVLVHKIIRNFVPLTRGNEVYETSGSLNNMSDVKLYLTYLHVELDKLIASDTVQTFGYAVSALFDKPVYNNQLQRISSLLKVFASVDDPLKLAQDILIHISGLGTFRVEEFPFEQASYIKADPTNDNTVAYGVRKYTSIGKGYVAFVGESSDSSLAIHKLFVSNISLNLGFECQLEVGPLGGCTIIPISEQSQGDWFVSLLNSRFNMAKPANTVQNIKSEFKAKQTNFNGGVSNGTTFKSIPNLKTVRNYSASPYSNQNKVILPCVFKLVSGNKYELIGYLTT